MRESSLILLFLGGMLSTGAVEASPIPVEEGEGAVFHQSASEGQDPPKTLSDFLSLAYGRNPAFAAARLEAEAALARVDQAGLLPDPNLVLGATNLALPEFSTDMPASMAPMVQASQRFPLAGKRGIEREVARHGAAEEEALSEAVWWSLRTEVASAYYTLFRIDQERKILGRSMGLLDELQTVALSSYGTGAGGQADVLRAGVARTHLEADEASLLTIRAAAVARLNRLTNRPTSTPVPAIDSVEPSPFGGLPARDSLEAWATAHQPALKALRTSLDRSEAAARLAERAIWPDLTVGFQYGLGRMNGDARSMGGATIGFSLPLHAGKRQRRLHDEALALEAAAREKLQDAMNSVTAEIATALAELDRQVVLLDLYRDDILPQARASVDASLAAYRVGELAFSDLIEAQLAVQRFEAERVRALSAYGTALARLEHLVGRTLSPAHEFTKDIP